ncbi:MAG TPA: BT_3928 family protein [Bacteroidia bacterium]|nr:BT_3928 family protein [Bacteroidia bacterium]
MRNTLTTISRILVGVLFIISGFIKANDPLGFAYKLDEYFVVFHTEWMSSVSLYLSMFICVFEVALGFALLLGAKIRAVAWSLLLMILFFTFLTFYSAYFDVVKDCGCFGDALHLTPWQSFTKDAVLLVLILIIFINRKNISSLLGEKASNLVAYTFMLVSFFFTLYCYRHLPVIDFRPYAVGKNILEGMTLPPDAKQTITEMIFIYEKDGKKVELNTEQLKTIDETYKFVDRKDKVIQQGDVPHIHDFNMYDDDGADYKEEFLSFPGYKFMLVAYDINKSDENVQHKINDFAALCQKEKIPFIGLSGSVAKDIDVFRHEHNSMFNYYQCDMTTLKTIIRSNPGLVLLNGATVVAIWHYNDFPSFDEVKGKHLSKIILAPALEN